MLLDAITSTPVPNIFSTMTSPAFTGAFTVTLLIFFIASKFKPFGIGPLVLTGSTGKLASFILTVEVITLTGFITSFKP